MHDVGCRAARASGLAVAMALAPGLVADGPESPDPFGNTAVVPSDVSLYLHVDGVATLRRTLEGRPLEAWISSLLSDAKAPRAWSDLAERVDAEPRQLLDLCFGDNVTLVRRRTEEAGSTWAVLTEVDPARFRPLERKIGSGVQSWRAGVAVYEWPEHGLLLARLGRVVMAGPTGGRSLLTDLIDRVAGGRQGTAATLASDPVVGRARELGGGNVGLIVRHDQPLGGWSALVADVEGDVVRLRQAGEFDTDPFERRITGLRCDFSAIESLRAKHLFTMLEPTDVGEGPLETFVMALLGEPIFGEAVRGHVGDLRIIAVGEEEGRQREAPLDVLAPTVALGVQIGAADGAVEALDQSMVTLARRINRVTGAPPEATESPPAPWPGDRERTLDISGIARLLPGGVPVMENVTLNWSVADGPHGRWYVIATNPRALEDVVESLERPDVATAGPVGNFDSVGSADGRRISRHLRSWAERADLLAAPGEAGAFRETLSLLAQCADGVEQCCWKLSRPAPRAMRLDVRLRLTGSSSAR
ncbi:MAG: hypothetical protein ACYTJ0_02480 [Planctomycetota bacterium]